ERVGDKHSRNGVLLAAQLREMHFPEILETRRRKHAFHCVRFAAFARTVVHDSHPWMKGMHKGFGIRTRLPMVQAQKQVHCANTIDRAHQFEFFIPREISEMHRSEFSKRHVYSYGLWIFSIVLARLEVRTIRIRFAGTR